MDPPPISGVSDHSNVQKLLILIRFSGFHGRLARHAHAQSLVIQFAVIPFERSRWRGGRQARFR
jgi:hypothetical protein